MGRASAALAVAGAAASVPYFPRAFLPAFNEGSLVLSLMLNPGTSLAEANRIGAVAEGLIAEVREGAVTRSTLEPGDVGLPVAAPESVSGGSPQENAATTRAILAGEPGPRRDLALLNAGAAIYAAGRAESIAEGVESAAAAVDSGAAARVVEHYVSLSMELLAS